MLSAPQNLITELRQHVWLGGYLLALSAGQADDALAERLTSDLRSHALYFRLVPLYFIKSLSSSG